LNPNLLDESSFYQEEEYVPLVDIEQIRAEQEAEFQSRLDSLPSYFLSRAQTLSGLEPPKAPPKWKRSGCGTCLLCGKQSTSLCFHFLVPHVNHVLNRIVTCNSCHQKEGNRDWIDFSQARSDQEKKNLIKQRETVLKLLPNHSLPLELSKGDGLRTKALALFQARWNYPRIKAYAGAYDFNKGSYWIAFEKGQCELDGSLLFNVLNLAERFNEDVNGWFIANFEASKFHEALAFLISRNGAVQNVDLSDVGFFDKESAHENRWSVLLPGERWITEFIQTNNKGGSR